MFYLFIDMLSGSSGWNPRRQFPRYNPPLGKIPRICYLFIGMLFVSRDGIPRKEFSRQNPLLGKMFQTEVIRTEFSLGYMTDTHSIFKAFIFLHLFAG